MEKEEFISYEKVKNQTTEDYFNGNEFSIDAFNRKYKNESYETYVQALKRVCDYVASVEKTKEEREYWSKRWFSEIYNDWWHPAGSIMQGAGSNRGISLSNCTTISLGSIEKEEEWDNLESIIRNTAYSVARTASYRQGLGVDFSRLRPKKSVINNSANESTGSIHWMKFIDSLGYYVGQKGRIPAMLFSISIEHPDVEEFIKVKSDRTIIQNANISVQVSDKFYKTVLKDGNADWELKFEIPEQKKGQRIYIDVHSADMDCIKDENGKYYYIAKRDRKKEVISKKIKAKELLNLIASNMFLNAEPGIQNIDIARKYSNSDYVYDPNDEYNSKIISTNACSEQYLSEDSLCVLASINAGKFSIDIEDYEKELSVIGYSVNRFLDNVNECELVYKTYATPKQRLAIEKLRRTGAGYTNLAGWLFKLNKEYGSEEGNDAIQKFTERYNYYLYKSSIELGKEKGSFGLFVKEKYIQSPFIQRMMGLGLEFDTMRNVTCSSIAPTGSLTLMFRETPFSYGIEPAFDMYYWKRTRISGQYEYYFTVPTIVRNLFAEKGYSLPMESDSIKDTWDGSKGKPILEHIEKYKNKLGINFINATKVDPFKKLDLMAKVGKWIDSSISVTYLLPENTEIEKLSEFILEAWRKEVKSIACFPDKQMYGIVSFIPFKDLAFKLKSEGIDIHEQNFTEEELNALYNAFNKGNSIVLTDKIVKTTAPKRPTDLPADVHHITMKGHRYYVAIGLYNKEPYEIFVGDNNDHEGEIVIPKSIVSGKISKKGRRNYILMSEGKSFTLSNIRDDDSVDALTRMISTSLRHGADISFIVHQLEKTSGGMSTFTKVLSRVLKKYITDGTVVHGESCPSCSSHSLIRHDGCVQCVDCGWSKCI